MNSPICWPGGKRALVRTLLPLIPPHRNYVEVFSGSAKLLFAKDPSHVEILNDVNGELINFFRVVKHRPSELAEALEHECIHAGRFRELVSEKSPCELERALRFVYLTWYGFGGKGTHFARPSATRPEVRHSLNSVRDLLCRTTARLSDVLIEQRDFSDILSRYDRKDTFFYLDPPYIEYQPNGRYEPLSKERRAQMFAMLARLKARWLMSFESHSEAICAAKKFGFRTRKVGVVYTLNGKSDRKSTDELLISNFPFAA